MEVLGWPILTADVEALRAEVRRLSRPLTKVLMVGVSSVGELPN